jgi:hypothetical protein
MPKLDIDLTAIKIRELLNHRKRDEALALAKEALASGKAKPETQKLAMQLFAGGRGRPKTEPYKWVEIGHEDYWLEVDGVTERERTLLLERKYDMSDKHIRGVPDALSEGQAGK